MQFRANPMRILSSLILIAVVNVFVFASAPVSANKETGSSKVLIGKLVTTSNRPIIVNGGEAITGTTILSGALLSTPVSGGAIVELNNLGTVVIEPSSTLVLTFDAKNVTAEMVAGRASVATVDGVTGKVLTASGKTAPNAPAPVSAETARNWGIAGVAVGGAGLIWALIAWNKANDANDQADAAIAANAALSAQLAALRSCLAGQTTSPLKLCTSF